MTRVHKEYYSLANFYYNSYLKEDKEITELMNAVNRGIRGKFTESIIAESLVNAKEKLTKIEEEMKKTRDNTEANPYILCLGFIFLLWEDKQLSISQAMTVNRLGNEIYSKIEKENQMSDGFRNANKILKEYENYKG